MKPLYLKPEQNKTPREQWEQLTEEEKWDEYLTALVTINEITEENETRASSHINN